MAEEFKIIQMKNSAGMNIFPKTMAELVKYDETSTVKAQIEALIAAGGEPNVLTAVKWNGTALEITNKAVDIYSSVSTFVAEEIGKQIHMNVEVVDALPETGTKGIIYLIAHTGTGTAAGTGGNYDEYIWTGSAFELIGTTAVDLTGYATETYVGTQISNKVSELGLDKLAETYAPIALVGRVEAIEAKVATWDAYAGQISAVDGKADQNAADIKTINESAVMTSGITADKVGAYDAYVAVERYSKTEADAAFAAKEATEQHIADGDIHVTAAQKEEWSGKQDAIENAANLLFKDADGYIIDAAGAKLETILYFEEVEA